MLRNCSRLVWMSLLFVVMTGLMTLPADWSTSAAEKEKPANSFGVDFTKELPRVPSKSPEKSMASFVMQPGFGLEIVAAEPLPLSYASREGDVALYSGAVPCRQPGQHAFAVRMLPFRRELPNKFETGKVSWWVADKTTSAASPTPKLSGVAAH